MQYVVFLCRLVRGAAAWTCVHVLIISSPRVPTFLPSSTRTRPAPHPAPRAGAPPEADKHHATVHRGGSRGQRKGQSVYGAVILCMYYVSGVNNGDQMSVQFEKQF